MANTSNRNKYLFVGDSREVGRARIAHDAEPFPVKYKYRGRIRKAKRVDGEYGNNYYYCEGGTASRWFDDFSNTIVQRAKDNDCDYIVINMGLNDWPSFRTKEDAETYAKSWMKRAKNLEKSSGKKVVFVSPYPTPGAYETNSQSGHYPHEKEDMNRYLGYFTDALTAQTKKNGFAYIDVFNPTNEYIKKNGWSGLIPLGSGGTDGIHIGDGKVLRFIDAEITKQLDLLPHIHTQDRQTTLANSATPASATRTASTTERATPTTPPAAPTNTTTPEQTPPTPPAAPTNTTTPEQTPPTTPPAAPAKTATTTKVRTNPRVGIIGASSTVRQGYAVGGRNIHGTNGNRYEGTLKDGNFICAKTGEGIDWLNSNVNKFKDCDVVVINLGRNDYWKRGSANKYLARIKQLAEGPWKDKQICFSSVTDFIAGEDGKLDPNRNKNVASFNKEMEKGIKNMKLPNVHFIDANKEFQKIKDKTISKDGIHYDDIGNNRPNKYLYDYIVKEGSQYYTPQVVQVQSQVQTQTGTQARTSDKHQTETQTETETQTQDQTSAQTPEQASTQNLAQTEIQDLEQVMSNSATNAVEYGERRTQELQIGEDISLNAKQQRNMQSWAKRVGISDTELQQLQTKYGARSYNMMLRALMEPSYMMRDLGEGNKNSLAAIRYMLNNDLDQEAQGKILQGTYGSLTGKYGVGINASSGTAGTTRTAPSIANEAGAQPEENANASVAAKDTPAQTVTDPANTNVATATKDTPAQTVTDPANTNAATATKDTPAQTTASADKTQAGNGNATSPTSHKERADAIYQLLEEKTPLNPTKEQMEKLYKYVDNQMKISYGKQTPPYSGKQIVDWVFKYSKENHVNPYLVLAIIEAESHFKHDAYNENGGALGICQIMPPRITGFQGNRADPEQSIKFATETLNLYMSNKKRGKHDRYFNNDILKTVKAYNYGAGALLHDLRAGYTPQNAGKNQKSQEAIKYPHTIFYNAKKLYALVGLDVDLDKMFYDPNSEIKTDEIKTPSPTVIAAKKGRGRG